ncbi:MAG: (2Fe-2S)-binding protein, partial [Beijerinckiaceae bacterium]|nr:(2Fe-2S)-binding protein [Beijerinckiaceae bacterium]
EAAEWVAYTVRANGIVRLAAFIGGELAGALFVGHGAAALSRTFLTQALTGSHDPEARLRLLAGRPAGVQADDGKTICVCYSIGSHVIEREIDAGAVTVGEIGARLKAGTNCGSCRSEIGRMIHERTLAEAN